MTVSQLVTKKFNPNFKDVNYLAKNFSEFRQNLIEFSKSYYPNTYADFNEASPGMMFIEMAAYVGDVLSFYIDDRFKENLLLFAKERNNVISISQAMGYKPRLAATSTVTARIYQLVPAMGSSTNYNPDARFFLKVLANSRFSSNTQPVQTFRSLEDVDFNDDTDRLDEVFSRDINQVPTTYIVSKPIKLLNAEQKTISVNFGSPKKFTRIVVPDTNFISIVSITDSDGNEWNEVDYLGQDIVVDERDISAAQPVGSTDPVLPSKLAVFRRKPRRFITRVNSDLKMEIWFGSGMGTTEEEIITLNSTQIANSKYDQRIGNTSLDPSDFLATDTFGLAPANTTLTITYLVGGGLQSNVTSGAITNVDVVNLQNSAQDYDSAEQGTFSLVTNSVSILNDEPATGGGNVETIEEMRQNALAFFNAQNRVVTDKDYVVRSLAMPPKFGSIAKICVIRDEQINSIAQQDESTLPTNTDTDPFNNRQYVTDPISPNAINLYVLGYNAQKNLTTLNSLVKQNLGKYLEQYRVLTDDVNILDAFIVNIAVEFSIVVYRNYNMNDVLARCIDAIKEFFNIDKWQINQAIIMNDVRLTIGSVEGVQTVTDVIITNKYKFNDGLDYQEYRYPISEAMVDDIVYPSLDPCIFEIRYPDKDIVGNARQ